MDGKRSLFISLISFDAELVVRNVPEDSLAEACVGYVAYTATMDRLSGPVEK
ncbi:MAG: hypothetical protein WEA36_02075 [Balneolaceae bacterium]